MTASPEDLQLWSIVERILRLKADSDDIADDIKEVYAEAKANGYDKTALGQIVAIERKMAKDPNHAEKLAIVDLYAEASERAKQAQASHAYAPARERTAA